MLPSNPSVRLMLLAALVLPVSLAALPAHSAETHTFEAPDGAYTFKFSQSLRLKYEFADGTGDVTGVGLSNPTTGDVAVTFLGPRDPDPFREVSEATQQAITDLFTKVMAPLPGITLKTSSMTTMLGQPAVDMVFQNARTPFSKENPQIKRYIFTIANGQAYNFECIYRAEKAEQFAPACDLAAATVRLQDGAAKATDATTDNDEKVSPTAGSCTKLELNKRTMEVTELTSDMLMKDQSPAMIGRVKKAHDAAMTIDERAGNSPSAQDCKDVDAIITTLK